LQYGAIDAVLAALGGTLVVDFSDFDLLGGEALICDDNT
jgi:hypothetical protein